MATYSIRQREKPSKVHQLAINGHIVSITRFENPRFTLELDITKNFSFVALVSHGQVTQPLLNKAIAFAKSNVEIKK